MDIKERRKALGWTRRDLADKAHVDPRTLQLIELGHSLDDESVDRCVQTLDAVEQGLPIPDWKTRLDAAAQKQREVARLRPDDDPPS